MDFATFETKCGVMFRNKQFLVQAFTHRSYLNENPKGYEGVTEHNERLEYLGDAVLELAVTEYLYKKYPAKPEGDLTSFRAALVNYVTIADVASSLGMNDFMLLSKGEAKDTGRARQVILANAFEALLGAIYLDQGYAVAENFVARVLLPREAEIVGKKLWMDAKSEFQAAAQEHTGVTPSYKILGEVGPDHAKEFTAGVHIGTQLVAKGTGASKQEAEQAAARAGLKEKGWE